MISKDRAKELQAKFYIEGDLTDEEAEELSAFRLIFDMEELKEEMRNDPWYKEIYLVNFPGITAVRKKALKLSSRLF
jgi:hypothetical protein